MLARLLLIGAFSLPGAVLAQTPERTPSQPVHTYHYDAKIICGFQPKPEDLKLARGVYGTTVNLWNPHAAPLEVELRLELTYPPEQMEAGTAIALDPIKLPPRTAVSVDCRSIEAIYFGYGFPALVIKAMLGMVSLQPIEVTAVWSAATPAPGGGADELTSVDVDRITPYLLEAELSDPAWNADAAPEDRLCDNLRRTSTIATGQIDAISYTFNEAPDEGPREVVRVSDVDVIAGNGGVVGSPVLIRLRRGLFPDSSFLDVSEMPVLSIGRRYLLMLPNHTWLIEPIGLDTTLRIETVGDRAILVDQEGLAVTDIHGGRLTQPVSTPERMGKTPTLIVDDDGVVAGAMSLDEYIAALLDFATDCPGPVIRGPYAAYPLVPSAVLGSE